MSLLNKIRFSINKSKSFLLSNSFKPYGSLNYRCNICGMGCRSKIEYLKREKPSCQWCGSTVRFRAVIHTLSMELFGTSFAIQDFPLNPSIKGIGTSDADIYAVRLKNKLGYINTYYHQEPYLDFGIYWEVDTSLPIAARM